MKKFSEFFTESILEKEKTKQEVDSIINEGIVDGFKKLASAGKEKLSKFKDAFADKAKELLSKTLGTLVKSLVSSIQSKDKKPADIKSQMESNPLFKDFLSETNAIEEIQSDFSKEDVEDVVKKEDNVTKESIEEYYKQNNIITEDFGDMADTITTKIFSSVYKIIAGALGAIGWVIKPSFRNWFDKLVRKVQKLFYRSKLGQSIKDLPPEVEQSVMEKFQAIIGIVVVVVMVWIIVSHIKGEGDSIGTGGDSEAGDLPAKGLNDPGATEEMTNNPAYINGYKAYREARIAAIMKEHPSLSRDAIIHNYRTGFMAEYNTAWHNGNMLQVNDGDISQTPIPKSDGTETATTSADNTSAEGKTDGTDQTTNTGKPTETTASEKSGNAELHGDDKVGGGSMPAHTFERRFLNEKMQEYRTSHPNASADDIERMKNKFSREFDVARAKGKILMVSDGKTISIDAKKANVTAFFNGSGAVEGKNVNLDALDKSAPDLEYNMSAGQMLDSGLTSVEFTSFGGIHVKLDLSNIPESDRKMPLYMLAEKYIKGVAEANDAARKASGAIGEYF